MSKRWTTEEVNFLIDNYSIETANNLTKLLNKTKSAIKTKATYLKLNKNKIIYKNNNINILLNDSINTFYWVGFMLADAHFSSNSKISFCLSSKDKLHLEKFKEYVKSNNIISEKIKITNFSKGSMMVRYSIGHREIIELLCKKFDIHSNKTIRPPDMKFYNFSTEQMIGLIIGFIDGDGSINYIDKNKNRVSINIRTHQNWEENLLLFRNILYNNFKYDNNYDKYITNLFKDKQELSVLCIGKQQVLHDLKRFAVNNDLPILIRKWDKILV